MFALRHAQRSLTDARTIHQTAEQAGRDLTTEERSRYDELMAAARRYAADAEEERQTEQLIARFSSGSMDFRPVVQDGSVRPSTPTRVEQRAVRSGRIEQATLVPSIREYRAAQAEGTDSLGGYTVPDQVSSQIVDRLEPSSVVMAAGPRVFTMSGDVLRVPMIGSGTTAAMVAENAAIPETNITFADATLTARKIAAIVRASNEWLEDSVPDARQIVERDLLRELGRKLDEQFFGGNGTPPNMRGLLNQAGVTATALSAAISLDAIAQAIERMEAAGASPSAIFVGPAVWGAVRRLKDGDQRYMLAPDPSGEARKALFGVSVYVTPFLSDAAIIADMSQVAVGVRDRVTLFFDQSRYAEYDQSLVRLTARFDIAVLNSEGVEILTDITV